MTNQWDFVIAAYAVTALGTMTVLWQSWRAMLRAEAAVTALSDRSGDDA